MTKTAINDEEDPKDLVIKYPTTSQYLALQENAPDIGDIIRANLGGERLTAFSLQRITVPSGGVTFWELPDAEEPVKELVGIVVHHTNPRAFWHTSMGESDGRTPPDCSSADGQFGTPTTELGPGGDCQICPMAVFGSAENGVGQACKKKMMLFLLRADSYFPIIVQVPTMSLRPMRDCFLGFSDQGRFYYAGVIGLSLERRMSGANPYSVIKPRRIKMLDKDEEVQVKQRVGDAVRALIVDTPMMPEQD